MKFASGTAISQILAVAATPILTRLFAPSAFGQLALFTSLYSILISIATLKIDQAILLPKERKTAELLSFLTVVISAAFSAVLLIGMVATEAFGLKSIPWFYFLLPVTLVVGALLTAGQQWCSRDKEFGYIGNGMVLSTVCNVLFAVVFARTRLFSGELVASFALANLAAAIYVATRKAEVFVNLAADLASVSTTRLKALLWEHRHLPIYVLPNVLLTSLAYQILPLLIAQFFDTDTTGLYAVANRLLVLPSIFIGNVVLEVFRSEFVDKLRQKSGYLQFFNRTLLFLVATVVPAYGAIWLLSPWLFHLVFGAKYLLAGDFARYLCLGVVGTFFVQSFAYVYVALDKTRISLLVQTGLSLGQILAFLTGAIEGDIRLALLFMSVFAFVASILFVYLAFHLIRIRVRSESVLPDSP